MNNLGLDDLIELIKTYNPDEVEIVNDLNEQIVKKYQLAKINNNQYHIIIMPFHERKYLNELIRDIKISKKI